MEWLRKRLDYLTELGEDWDSYGGARITQESADAAYEFAVAVGADPWCAAPCGTGQVYLGFRGALGEFDVFIGGDMETEGCFAADENARDIDSPTPDVVAQMIGSRQ